MQGTKIVNLENPLDNLIFDRITKDVVEGNKKGYYNFNDLNRIENWCRYLSDYLNKYNYTNSIITKTNWAMSDLPYNTELERIRKNIQVLKNIYFSISEIPENLNFMTIDKANIIEKILDEIDYILAGMENNFIYCGVAKCGESRIWQQRFRKSKAWISQPYKLSQYTNTDTLKMITADNKKSIELHTKILELGLIDKRDDIYASIQGINNSMQLIDNLVGYECVYYTLKNLCPAIDGVNGFNIRSNSGTATGESSTAYTKYSQQALKLSIVDTNTTEVYASSSTALPLNPEHIYYARLEAYQETLFGGMEIYFPIAEPHMFNLDAKSTDKWNIYSTVINRTSFTAGNYTFRLDFNRGGSTATTGSVWYDGWMIIDLTEAFGTSNEPTKEWCDVNIPYFVGTQIIKIRKEND